MWRFFGICATRRGRGPGGNITEMGIMSTSNDPFSDEGVRKDLQTFAPLNNLQANLWVDEQ